MDTCRPKSPISTDEDFVELLSTRLKGMGEVGLPAILPKVLLRTYQLTLALGALTTVKPPTWRNLPPDVRRTFGSVMEYQLIGNTNLKDYEDTTLDAVLAGVPFDVKNKAAIHKTGITFSEVQNRNFALVVFYHPSYRFYNAYAGLPAPHTSRTSDGKYNLTPAAAKGLIPVARGKW